MKDNPYQTPESDLTTEEVQLPKTLWWKIFFFFSLIFVLMGYAGVILVEEMTFAVLESIDLVVSSISMVALFGLAFNKAIGNQVFWRYFFYIYLVIFIAFSTLSPLLGLELYGQVQAFDGLYAFGVIIGLIFIRAIYLYGFKRAQLWNLPSD